ncbi:MAG: hypothetical protein V4819_21720 [Verrucomicrobiota bacterium]
MEASDSPVNTTLPFFLRMGESDGIFRANYKPRDHARLRSKVWEAAADEADALHLSGKTYEPLDDMRVRWMLDWCDVIAGTKRGVDDGLAASMEFALQRKPPTLSGRERAAGAHLETLAQGS